MSKGYKLFAVLFAAAFAFAVFVIIYSAVECAGTEQLLEEVDAFIEKYEQRTQEKPVSPLDLQIESYLAEMETFTGDD